jgi:Tfp pilus assembly protein PilF
MSASYTFVNEAHRRALELFRNEDFQAAMLQFSISLETHPSAPDIYHDRALCFLRMDRPQLALDDLNKALSLQPEHGYRYSSRAYIKAFLKDFDGAFEDYRKAIELDPQDAISINNLGLLEEQFGRVNAAKQLYAQADELSKILEENNIDRSSTQSFENTQASESNPIISTPKSRWNVIADVFSNPEERKDFIKFLKNGFRR